MQIEIDIEKLISRSVIDGLTNSERLQDEILDNDELRETLIRHIKSRIEGILSSEEGVKTLDKMIIDKIIESDRIQDEIDNLLNEDEYQNILTDTIKNRFKSILSSEECREQILDKIKSFIEDFNIEDDSDLQDELNKELSEILLSSIRIRKCQE